MTATKRNGTPLPNGTEAAVAPGRASRRLDQSGPNGRPPIDAVSGSARDGLTVRSCVRVVVGGHANAVATAQGQALIGLLELFATSAPEPSHDPMQGAHDDVYDH